jgi:trimeric autotransporter adhesin
VIHIDLDRQTVIVERGGPAIVVKSQPKVVRIDLGGQQSGGGGFDQAAADERYINAAGDTMTGILDAFWIRGGAINLAAESFEEITFRHGHAIRTHSGSNDLILDIGQVGRLSVFGEVFVDGNKITGLAAGSAATDAVNMGQISVLLTRVEALEREVARLRGGSDAPADS